MTVAKSTNRQPFHMALTLGQAVNSGLQYSTVVGWGNTNGTYAVCGNGKIEGSEACDDGNTKACDGCSSVCLRETLADSVACGGLDFAPPVCGNGILESGETCDDGNTKSCDRCSSTCQIEQGLGDLVDCGGSFTTVAFRRGDANGDGRVDLADATAMFDFATCLEHSPGCTGDLNSLACRVNYALCYFAPSCDDARDANDDGSLNRSDGYFLVGWILYGGPTPPAPGPYTVGPDPTTQDQLGCAMYRS